MSDDSTNLRQEFVTELESILESDEAYGSNLQILTYALKEDVVNGKFKDSWNTRVYEFIIDIDGISYKPAAKLDSFSADERPVRFDSYSEGYASLFVDVRFDGKLTGKRTKKPKCGVEAFGCGYSCIGLLKTCRIPPSGGKSAIGKERLNKLIAKAGKLYAEGNQGGAVASSVAANKITDERSKKAGQLREERRQKIKQQQVKTATKTQEKQPAKLKPEPTTNPKTHSIKTQKEFEDVMLHVIDKVNKEGKHDGLVPIYEARKAVGELVSRDKFNEFMRKMQSEETITMSGGELSGNTLEKTRNSLAGASGEIRYHVRLTPKAEESLNTLNATQRNKINEKLKNRPELDPLGSARQYAKRGEIKSQKTFNEVTEKVFNTLNEEFNYFGLVPITKIKEVLKDRVSKNDLNEMLLNFHDNDKHQLIGHGTLPIPPELVDGEVKTALGSRRHYIMKVNS